MISDLDLWVDTESRIPSGQMAVDEALLLSAESPVLRLYRWSSPAVTFGYAQRYAEVAGPASGLPAIRRWTGGGIVFHGRDLTLTLAVPEPHPLCRLQPAGIYLWIHKSLLKSLEQTVPDARLAGEKDCRPGPACFQSPALNDILAGGRKICGGALRRGKKGFLYQGSLHGDFSPGSLGESLAGSVMSFQPEASLLCLADSLEKERYSTQAWNRMR